MNLSSLAGNAPVKAALSGNPFHAYLIEGQEGAGKRTLADLLAGSLICPMENAPCGNCPHCKKLATHCHPDLIDIPPDTPMEGLREHLADLLFSPNEGKHKVYRVFHAETMLPAAQNLLLKTLEEPPHYAVFILICSAKEGMLSTVVSRCRTLSLSPLSREEMERCFREKYGEIDENVRRSIDASGGILGQAYRLYETGDSTADLIAEQIDRAVLAHDVGAVFELLNFSERDALMQTHNALLRLAKRRLRTAQNGTLRRMYATQIARLEQANDGINANFNLKLWNVNLARLVLSGTQAQR